MQTQAEYNMLLAGSLTCSILNQHTINLLLRLHVELEKIFILSAIVHSFSTQIVDMEACVVVTFIDPIHVYIIITYQL